MGSEPVLVAGGLAGGYGKKLVFEGMELEVRAKEVLTLMGPNGAGKSTVLKTLAGQLKSFGGRVVLCGRDMQEQSRGERAAKAAVLLTGRVDTERMTCFETAAAGRYPYTGRLGILREQDVRAVRDAMELTGTWELRDRELGAVSDGQRQLVMTARAIAQEPEIMLLDEPTSYLDIDRKLRVLRMLREYANSHGTAVVMTLHELDLAQRFSDRVLCIKEGRPFMTGTPAEVFRPGNIEELYGMSAGAYDCLHGTAELLRTGREPEAFVIGGGGMGMEVYRDLQRRGIPFAAGVIHENDTEYFTALTSAEEVISERAFEPVGEKAYGRARQVMRDIMARGGRVICCCENFGTMNRLNLKLKEEAGL
ncbi:MAG: ABC transporter ATP-binding protein [Ruminococcus sp.]|nr:ABC transporter ATP-binding protein [Ruminococcus sp.]